MPLQAPGHQRLLLNIPRLLSSLLWSLQELSPEEGSCTGNYVELVDGVINQNVRRLIPRFCGHSIPAVHTSSSDTVSIHYVTNTNNTGMGWRAVFQIADGETLSGSTPTGGLVPSI